jgi:hypothetical protein
MPLAETTMQGEVEAWISFDCCGDATAVKRRVVNAPVWPRPDRMSGSRSWLWFA